MAIENLDAMAIEKNEKIIFQGDVSPEPIEADANLITTKRGRAVPREQSIDKLVDFLGIGEIRLRIDAGSLFLSLTIGGTEHSTQVQLPEAHDAAAIANLIKPFARTGGPQAGTEDLKDNSVTTDKLDQIVRNLVHEAVLVNAISQNSDSIQFVSDDGSSVSIEMDDYIRDLLTEMSDFPSSYEGHAGQFPRVKHDETGIEFANLPSRQGSSKFIDQTDTPASYSGQAGKAPVVNAGSNAMEFKDFKLTGLGDTPDQLQPNQLLKTNAAGDGVVQTNDDLLALGDTPASYSGQAGKALVVNENENATDFAAVASGDRVAALEGFESTLRGDFQLANENVRPPILNTGYKLAAEITSIPTTKITITVADRDQAASTSKTFTREELFALPAIARPDSTQLGDSNSISIEDSTLSQNYRIGRSSDNHYVFASDTVDNFTVGVTENRVSVSLPEMEKDPDNPAKLANLAGWKMALEIPAAVAGGASTFIQLGDTPASFEGHDGQYAKVKGSALEFSDLPAFILDASVADFAKPEANTKIALGDLATAIQGLISNAYQRSRFRDDVFAAFVSDEWTDAVGLAADAPFVSESASQNAFTLSTARAASYAINSRAAVLNGFHFAVRFPTKLGTDEAHLKNYRFWLNNAPDPELTLLSESLSQQAAAATNLGSDGGYTYFDIHVENVDLNAAYKVQVFDEIEWNPSFPFRPAEWALESSAAAAPAAKVISTELLQKVRQYFRLEPLSNNSVSGGNPQVQVATALPDIATVRPGDMIAVQALDTDALSFHIAEADRNVANANRNRVNVRTNARGEFNLNNSDSEAKSNYQNIVGYLDIVNTGSNIIVAVDVETLLGLESPAAPRQIYVASDKFGRGNRIEFSRLAIDGFTVLSLPGKDYRLYQANGVAGIQAGNPQDVQLDFFQAAFPSQQKYDFQPATHTAAAEWKQVGRTLDKDSAIGIKLATWPNSGALSTTGHGSSSRWISPGQPVVAGGAGAVQGTSAGAATIAENFAQQSWHTDGTMGLWLILFDGSTELGRIPLDFEPEKRPSESDKFGFLYTASSESKGMTIEQATPYKGFGCEVSYAYGTSTPMAISAFFTSIGSSAATAIAAGWSIQLYTRVV